MYSADVQTVVHELVGPSTYTLVPGTDTKRIVGFSMQQSNVASITEIKCGTTVIARNYGKDFPHTEVSRICNDKIEISKTGNDNSTVTLSYTTQTTNATIPVTIPNDFYSAMNGLSWLMFIGFGLIIMLEAINIGNNFID
jgi:hypothetical protein